MGKVIRCDGKWMTMREKLASDVEKNASATASMKVHMGSLQHRVAGLESMVSDEPMVDHSHDDIHTCLMMLQEKIARLEMQRVHVPGFESEKPPQWQPEIQLVEIAEMMLQPCACGGQGACASCRVQDSIPGLINVLGKIIADAKEYGDVWKL